MAITHFTSFTRDDQETEIEVEYSFRGGCAAHYGSLNYPGHPAEPPEVEITKAYEIETEKEVTLTDTEYERMTLWIMENHFDDYDDDY